MNLRRDIGRRVAPKVGLSVDERGRLPPQHLQRTMSAETPPYTMNERPGFGSGSGVTVPPRQTAGVLVYGSAVPIMTPVALIAYARRCPTLRTLRRPGTGVWHLRLWKITRRAGCPVAGHRHHVAGRPGQRARQWEQGTGTVGVPALRQGGDEAVSAVQHRAEDDAVVTDGGGGVRPQVVLIGLKQYVAAGGRPHLALMNPTGNNGQEV